eukprot:TRINITY_DN992_c0_g1_i2.p1 TRINITY_DN992_c0_g1~~TRINITY_DN992_c0_g1_i2.p1  ORF type:complete len:398 (-),score=158.53 TRINITY_DN992_c0_g1_i2:193-1386(-)
MFVLTTFSIFPVAYVIGMAISSLSVQSSYAVGTVVNASFGTFVEIILYFTALRLGTLEGLVQASITGTLLGMMLLLPGLAMMVGGIKYKQQNYNRTATGVSSILLLISVVGAFTPTIFYTAYGSYVLDCGDCETLDQSSWRCSHCSWTEGNFVTDPIYVSAVRPIQFFCATVLPLSYFVGIWFTLKTHSHIYDLIEDENHEGGGHEAPEWSKKMSIAILLGDAILFGLVAEQLVQTIEPVILENGISPRFFGLTFVALVTSTIEFLNAILFAYHNNLSLALEIANSYCVQVALIQMPALVFISAFLVAVDGLTKEPFTLIFPVLDLYSVIFGLFVLIFISQEGRANYFLGCALVFVYSLLIFAFFFSPTEGDASGHGHVHHKLASTIINAQFPSIST